MSLCPESEARAAMSDEDFWDHVFGQDDDVPWDEYDRRNGVTPLDAPCEVCGSVSACMYDPNGLPLVHQIGDAL